MASWDSVNISVTIYVLIDLEVLAWDILNEYLNYKCQENIWTMAGP